MNKLGHILKHDIRDFLRDLIERKKARNPQFSQRAYAHFLGFSTSTFNEILKGKRKLTKKSIEKLVLGLSQDKDVESCLADWSQSSLAFESIRQVELENKAWEHLLSISKVANKKSPEERLFCSLVVTTNQKDFEFIHARVSKALESIKDPLDHAEVIFAYLEGSRVVLERNKVFEKA